MKYRVWDNQLNQWSKEKFYVDCNGDLLLETKTHIRKASRARYELESFMINPA